MAVAVRAKVRPNPSWVSMSAVSVKISAGREERQWMERTARSGEELLIERGFGEFGVIDDGEDVVRFCALVSNKDRVCGRIMCNKVCKRGYSQSDGYS